MEWYDKLEKLREILGDKEMFIAVSNYFSSSQMEDFCDSVINEYDLESEFENN
jgi:hypothetical protein